jgi:hypothetical protein
MFYHTCVGWQASLAREGCATQEHSVRCPDNELLKRLNCTFADSIALCAPVLLQPVLDQAELESMGVEAAVAAMRSHAQAVEEQAFYDSLAARMAATLRVRW